MKIAIFGGTGMTGQCAVEHAITKGYNIRLLYRTESTVPESFRNCDKVELIQGNVLNVDDVKTMVNGMDGVCVVLGTRNSLEPTKELSIGMQNIVNAMQELNIKIVSVCLSGFLYYEPDKVPKQFTDLNREHQTMYDILKETDLNYIAVFPPHITKEPSGKHQIVHGKSAGRMISKYDLGNFLIDSLSMPEHYRNTCGIATILPI